MTGKRAVVLFNLGGPDGPVHTVMHAIELTPPI